MVTPPKVFISAMRLGSRPSRAAAAFSVRIARAWARNSSAVSVSSALQQQADDLQKIFVPADCDSVLGHSAKARHHAVVERLVNLIHVPDGPERRPVPMRCYAG